MGVPELGIMSVDQVGGLAPLGGAVPAWRPVFQAVQVTSGDQGFKPGELRGGGVAPCAAPSAAVLVWRPAFRAGAPT